MLGGAQNGLFSTAQCLFEEGDEVITLDPPANAPPLGFMPVVRPRVERLEPGDRIVLVATASPHREAALAACHFLIDWLKTEAPFWKSEETPTGEHWVEARAEDEAARERWTPGLEV